MSKKTPTPPKVPAPVKPTVETVEAVKPELSAEQELPVEQEQELPAVIKVRHKKSEQEFEVSRAYYQRNKSVLECL